MTTFVKLTGKDFSALTEEQQVSYWRELSSAGLTPEEMKANKEEIESYQAGSNGTLVLKGEVKFINRGAKITGVSFTVDAHTIKMIEEFLNHSKVTMDNEDKKTEVRDGVTTLNYGGLLVKPQYKQVVVFFNSYHEKKLNIIPNTAITIPLELRDPKSSYIAEVDGKPVEKNYKHLQIGIDLPNVSVFSAKLSRVDEVKKSKLEAQLEDNSLERYHAGIEEKVIDLLTNSSANEVKFGSIMS